MRTLISLFFLASINVAVMSQPAELKYNLEKGKTYKIKSSSVQDQTMTVQGTERKTETKNVSYFSLKMLDAKPDFFLAEVKFDTMRTTVSMPPMELTSTEKGDINAEDPVEVTKCILNRLSNSTMVVRLDYGGHVQDIMNHNVIEQTVLQGTDSLKGQAAMAKGQLEMMVTKEALVGMIEGITAYLPNTKVIKGDTWESSVVSKQGGVGMAINTSFVLKELTQKNGTIEGDIIIEPASTGPTMMNGAEITNKLRGLGESNMVIDPNTGWLIKASSKIRLSGTMDVKAPGQNMSLPMETLITSESLMIE